MKKLIINVDDVGFADEINKAVKECYLQNVISSVSIMPGGDFFDEAVTMLKDINKTEVGVHLTLTGKAHPCASINDINTILNRDKTFYNNYFEFMKYYFLNKINMSEIYLELKSQISKVKKTGLEITHLDSHEHVHMFPKVLHLVLKLAKEFNIPHIRFPNERFSTYSFKFTIKDMLRHLGLKLFCLNAKTIIKDGNVKFNNNFWGHFHSGRIDNEILSFIIKNISQGINELGIHPAVKSEKFIGNFPWYKNAHIELETLLSEKWKEIIVQNNISIVSHSNL
jgi:predicted glycoside hydrolase/deacetylase ChbG (UPF0249 family)